MTSLEKSKGLNLRAARHLIDQAVSLGVREFCICAGARNSPLVAVLAASEGLELYSFPEERSAAFFALGRTRLTGAPAAVVTTSGTAVAELLPAVIEAHYSCAPLLCITADRPRSYRGTGAPQSIEQLGIFGGYVESCLDIEAGEEFSLGAWLRQRPLHVNLAFDEPLLDAAVTAHIYGTTVASPVTRKLATPAHAEQLLKFLNRARRPLVIVGGLSNLQRAGVKSFLCRLGAPIYAEPLSGLREDADLAPLLLKSGERVLRDADIDAVLRLGDVPALNLWRDLEGSRASLPVLHLNDKPFTGLSRGEMIVADLASLLATLQPESRPFPELHAIDARRYERLLELFALESRSEPALIHALSRKIPPAAHVFLGNSMPIREWDLAALRRPRAVECTANRGANGIDGELSTFFGLCRPHAPNWALLGDLTTVYDLAGPWVVPQLPEEISFSVVVVNNGGGRIFARVPSLAAVPADVQRKFFENSHPLQFEPWANFWNLGYERWTSIPAYEVGSSRGIIELVPDAEATRRFWTKFEQIGDAL